MLGSENWTSAGNLPRRGPRIRLVCFKAFTEDHFIPKIQQHSVLSTNRVRGVLFYQ